MNTKSLFALMMIICPLIFASCEKNKMDDEPVMDDNPVMDDSTVILDYRVQNVLYEEGSKLKNISYVESVKSKIGGIIITQYEYDEQGRIIKASAPMYKEGTPMFENGTIVGLSSYSDYVYNDDGLLEKIIYCHLNLYAGFINLQTTTYSYDKDGHKRKEVIVSSRTDSTLYYYENNRLKREDKYSDGFHGGEVWTNKLTDYIEYEYDNQGDLVKETYYSADNDTPYQIIVHNYPNGLNVKTEVIIYSNNEKIREIRRYYDKNDNVIYVESEELSPYSSMMSSVMRYEYYP